MVWQKEKEDYFLRISLIPQMFIAVYKFKIDKNINNVPSLPNLYYNRIYKLTKKLK